MLAYAVNREKFAAAASNAPGTFSHMQMDAYLKSSRFKQQIEGFKQALGGADASNVRAANHVYCNS
jgi:hypothetical protein